MGIGAVAAHRRRVGDEFSERRERRTPEEERPAMRISNTLIRRPMRTYSEAESRDATPGP